MQVVPLRGASVQAPQGRGRAGMIPPAVLARLGGLELVAKAVVDGMLHGAHRSDRPGFSQEFDAYRDYVPGDDLRFVDWNAYARNDRLLLKLFEGETNTRLWVLVDVSASMAVGGEPSKLRYGAWLAAALMHVAGRQHDGTGLMTFNDEVRTSLAPRPGAAHRQTLYHRLDAMTAQGGSNWHRAFTEAARRGGKRGIIAAISDFYCQPHDFGQALRLLGADGHDVIVFHLLSAEERRPKLRSRGSTTLRDAETGRLMEVDPGEVRTAYPSRVASHEAALRREANAVGADYVRMSTDEPLDRALGQYLRFRRRRP